MLFYKVTATLINEKPAVNYNDVKEAEKRAAGPDV